ncbi:TetR/AcrR family transcriptional regulator [Parabacteroides bouchesdurhonensis]|uniref:TetR/AcrR family transcriptional regulator n=1 Tax=Parabacteroides bouchesdurhonensis TaxID=1936995 RepID=UPI000E4D9FC8|nr:TetR/AcrR family transcriptional regulator [Parabacteroides bouchesdurhonensis]RHJ91771.1 TetR/AcrR family transcriptional regulator [Bacteroides sp. AM07-16]
MEESVDMESRIIEAAKKVFVRKGFDATKMSDIAAEVGIGRTALHYYFRTKEMLFDAIFGQLIGKLLPNIGRIVDDDSTILEKMPKLVEQYTSTVYENPYFPIFAVQEINRDSEHLFRTVMKEPERLQPILRLQQQIKDEMEKGLLKKMPLIDVASTLVSLVVFPTLIREPLTVILLDGNVSQFDEFLFRRKTLVTEVMIRLLTPDSKE